MSYTTISGVVKDKRTNKKLEYVTITVPGTSIGTITNADGTFSIKVNDSLQAEVLELRHIGYSNLRFPIKEQIGRDVTIYMTSNSNLLKDVIVTPKDMDARKVVQSAIQKIANNNSQATNLLTGFYRETIRKRRNYINISEAIIDVYKTPYTQGVADDKVQVYKGRRILSPKPGDTIAVKFIGGPNLSIFLDVVKNRDVLLDVESLPLYKFKWEESAMVEERPHYVISFEPQAIVPYALHYGKFYIDQQTLTFSRVEFSLSMDDRNKVTRMILQRKPFNLRFKPEEVSYIVTYKLENGISYLNYIRNEVRFKCDWKRKLFSTGYTIVSELVITDRKEGNVEKIPNKLAFDRKNSLSDKVRDFYDPDFWGNYNIIEPTESLENAVNKLKKQQNK
ncbi:MULTISPECIES: carboxypeptidase-like regulatory domain-containing protein [unclassified Dysgonomonas]|nr:MULTISPECIES: carboxypeptidase-like regulatory domain-containing protein [unclassified Dysgonomonas]